MFHTNSSTYFLSNQTAQKEFQKKHIKIGFRTKTKTYQNEIKHNEILRSIAVAKTSQQRQRAEKNVTERKKGLGVSVSQCLKE
jgi:hypothetical protein